MATQVQFRGGTTSQHGSFTGAVREVTVDTDKETLVVHDGSTAGGFPMARADASNLTFAVGSDIKTTTAGTSNFRAGVNAGNSIASGGNYNTVVGDEAGTALTTGDFNTALGYQSLESEIGGQSSTAIGYRALYAQNTSNDNNNTAVGRSAGLSITSGTNNTLIGGLCGDALTDADNNVALGNSALGADTLGSRSTALGRSALASQNFTSATDSYNVAVGYNAGVNVVTGVHNTIIGGLAGDALTVGSANVAIGFQALTTEDGHGANTAVGYRALRDLNAGATGHNVAIGNDAGILLSTGTINTLVGSGSGDAMTIGLQNVGVGFGSLGSNVAGHKNVGLGTYALYNMNAASSTNTFNTAVGDAAGSGVTSGIQNTLIGAIAGDALTDSDGNTALGYGALSAEQQGNKSTAVGWQALLQANRGSSGDSFNVAVGYNAGSSVSTGLRNTFIGGGSGSTITSGGDNTILGRYNGNQGGLDIRTLSNRIVLSDGDGTIRLYINNTGTVLVGKTGQAANVAGTEIEASGTIVSTRASNTNLFLNRTGNTGNLIEFRNANSAKGILGSDSSNNMYFACQRGSGILMSDDTVLACNANGAAHDDVTSLGTGNNRFDNVFATNGTINTSDRNEKQDIEQLSDAETRVAVVAKGLMRKYRWKSRVAEKGDKARTHFGIIAQDLQDAFTAESLDASDYAMFCSDTWWEKEISVDAIQADEANNIEAKDAYTYIDIKEEATTGYTEKTRLGVRYSELLAFIITAI